jgi:hypothetical protein
MRHGPDELLELETHANSVSGGAAILRDCPIKPYYRFGHTIPQEQTAIVSEHRISDRRFHTNAGCATGDEEPRDIQSFQNGIELGLIEPAESMLVQDNVVSLRREVRNNIRVPSVSD